MNNSKKVNKSTRETNKETSKRRGRKTKSTKHHSKRFNSNGLNILIDEEENAIY